MADGSDGGGTPPGEGEAFGRGGEAARGAPQEFGYGTARPCPDCRGGGKVVLLTSGGPCARCGGTGLEGVAPAAPEAGAAAEAGGRDSAESSYTEFDDAGRAVAVVRTRCDGRGRLARRAREALGPPGPACFHYGPSGPGAGGGAGAGGAGASAAGGGG